MIFDIVFKDLDFSLRELGAGDVSVANNMKKLISSYMGRQKIYLKAFKNDDEKIGVNSTAILWGRNSILYSKILHIFFYICLLIIGIINSFSYFFYIFFFLLIYLFIRQAKIIKKKNYIEAFKINNWIGVVALVSFVFEIIYLS